MPNEKRALRNRIFRKEVRIMNTIAVRIPLPHGIQIKQSKYLGQRD